MITLKVKSVNKYMVTCSLAKKKSKIINALLYLHNFDLHAQKWLAQSKLIQRKTGMLLR